MRRVGLAVGLALACALASGSARADDEESANREFERGVDLFRTKKYKDAAESFVRAERLAPRAATAYNAARAFKAAGDPLRAADELSTALRLGGLSDEQRRDANDQLAKIEPTCGSFDLSGPRDGFVRIGSREEKVPTRMHVAAGTYTVIFTQGTATDEQQVTIRRGERLTMEMRFFNVPQSTPLPPPKPGPPPATASTVTTDKTPAKPSKPLELRKPIAIGTMVAGGLFLAGGIAVGMSGLDARDRFVEGGRVNISLHSKAESQRTTANVLGTIGILAIAGGFVLFVTAPSSSSTNVAVGVGPNGASLAGTLP